MNIECAVAHGKKQRYLSSVNTAYALAHRSHIGSSTDIKPRLLPAKAHLRIARSPLRSNGLEHHCPRPAATKEAEKWPGRRAVGAGDRPHIHRGRGVVEEAGSQEGERRSLLFIFVIDHVFEDAAFVLRVSPVSILCR